MHALYKQQTRSVQPKGRGLMRAHSAAALHHCWGGPNGPVPSVWACACQACPPARQLRLHLMHGTTASGSQKKRDRDPAAEHLHRQADACWFAVQGSTASEWREAASAAALLGSNGEALAEAMSQVSMLRAHAAACPGNAVVSGRAIEAPQENVPVFKCRSCSPAQQSPPLQPCRLVHLAPTGKHTAACT